MTAAPRRFTDLVAWKKSMQLGELETQILIASRLGYLNAEQLTEIQSMSSETGRLMVGLMHSLEKHAAAS